MNRRTWFSIGLLALGLLLGILIGRWFMPERYGWLTMALLVLGGMVAGALLVFGGLRLGAGDAKAGAESEPFRRAFVLGTRRIVIRTDPEWGARWLGDEKERAPGWRGLWDVEWARVELNGTPLVFGALALGVVAQLLILGRLLAAGLALYAVMGVLLIVWVWRQKISLFEITNVARVGRRAEIILVVVILLIAFGARLWQAGNMPFGIDGDELKWTAQTYYDFVAHEKAGDFSEQQQYTPVSFYVDKVAFDLFGVDFNSPRVMTALLSVLATLVFYFVARDMFNSFVGLVALLFMATSYFDINASRQAIAQTFTKLPLLLGMWLLIRGIDRQRWFYFLLCGFVLYLGVMTSDTFYVVPPALLLSLLFRAVLDWRKWYRWILYAVLMIVPLVLAYPIVTETVRGRQSTYLKGVAAGISDLTSQNAITPILENTQRSFTVLFRALQGADYALNWDGALVNPLVLILFALGFALVLARFWQRHNLLLILTFVICFFPAPILSGYALPRVLYLGLPPILIFAAVALAVTMAALLSRNLSRVVWARALGIGLVLVLALIVASDGFIYTQQLRQLPDWLKRRYLVNTFKQSVSSAPLTILPVTRTEDDFIWGHDAVLKFLAYSARQEKSADELYQVVSFEELPAVLGSLAEGYASVNILYDKELGESNTLARATIDTLKRCYGNLKSRSGSFFVTFTMEGSALRAPNCYSLTHLDGTYPAPGEPVPANQPLTFSWDADSDRPTAYRVEIAQRNPKLIWIEAENFRRENGWVFEAKSEHYPPYSGDGYLLDQERSTPNELNVQIPAQGKYQVWVRSLRPGKEGHRSFVSVGGQTFEFARAGEAPYLQWNWEMTGEVDLPQGETTLTLSREYGKESWKPVLIDALFLSAATEFNPNQAEMWSVLMDTGEIDSQAQEHVVDKGLAPGMYRWRVQLLDGKKLVDASGEPGIWSDWVEFSAQ